MGRSKTFDAAEREGALSTAVPTATGWLSLLMGAGFWLGRWPERDPWLAHSVQAGLAAVGVALLWLSFRVSRCEQSGSVVRAYGFARAARALGALVLASGVLTAGALLWFGRVLRA